jgi:hypothetical protein
MVGSGENNLFTRKFHLFHSFVKLLFKINSVTIYNSNGFRFEEVLHHIIYMFFIALE